MQEYKFYINDIEIEEPRNWSDIQFKVARDVVYFGLQRKTSLEDVELWGEGAQIIKNLFDVTGVNSQATLWIERLNYDVLQYEMYQNGVVNFEDYTENYSVSDGFIVSVGLIDSSIYNKLANREKSELIVGGAQTIEGESTSALSRSTQSVIFKSRGIKNIAKMSMEGNFSGISNTSPGNTFREMKHTALALESFESNIPFRNNTASNGPLDISNLNTVPQFSGFANMNTFQISLGASDKDYSITLDYAFRARISTNFSGTGTSTFNNLKFRVYECDYDGVAFTNPVAIKTNTFSISVNVGIAGGAGFVDVADTFVLNKKAGKIYFISIDALGQNWGLGFSGDVEGTMDYEYDSFIDESENTSVFIYQAVLSALEQITDTPLVLYSEVLGKPADGYSSYGEFSKIVVTNGLFLRNAINSDNTDVDLTVNFKDLYTTITNLLGLALWFDVNDGLIHIEKRSEAFSGNQVELTLSNIERTLANEFLITSVKVGNDNVAYENVNGANEFNTILNFNTPLNVKSKVLNLVTAYNTDYLGVELARSLQFNRDANIDTKYDEKVFLVEVQLVSGDWISRMGDTYPVVAGIPLPESAGNILFSPKRSLIRNSDLIYPSFTTDLSAGLVFSSAKNLAALTSKDTNAGDFIIERDNVVTDEMIKLFKPIYIKGEVAQRDVWKLFLEQNTIYKFQVNGKEIKAYLWSADIEKDVATIEMLEKI